MFLITGFLFFVFVLCCAFTHLFAGMLISRFLAGSASSTFSTMVGGVVSDIYIASERNTAMALFTAGALFGTGMFLHCLQYSNTLTVNFFRYRSDGIWIHRSQY